jgi:hypothetical protein
MNGVLDLVYEWLGRERSIMEDEDANKGGTGVRRVLDVLVPGRSGRKQCGWWTTRRTEVHLLITDPSIGCLS